MEGADRSHRAFQLGLTRQRDAGRPAAVGDLPIYGPANAFRGVRRWKQGAELVTANCRALVVANLDDRRIDIEVVGPPQMRRSALNVVLDDLEAVHLLNPEAAPRALVPLPDNPDAEVSYEHLLRLEEDKGPHWEYYPDGAKHEYKVSDLLDGVRFEVNFQDVHRRLGAVKSGAWTVILIHGIRTRALWQKEIEVTLRRKGFIVQPTIYRYYRLVPFLVPFQILSRGVIREIERQIRQAIDDNGIARCSLIAHSFGTYVVAQIIREQTDIKFD